MSEGSPPIFFAHEPLAAGALVTLGEDAAHHARVRRLEPGESVALRDGAGRAGVGRLTRLAKSHAVVELARVDERPPPPPVHLLVPVGDRDRMLWLAEKCVEIGAASWRPVLWRRSRSVGPRGEGAGFQQKVRLRMIAALTQSGAAWLPELHPDATVERAAAAAPEGPRIVLDPDGESLLDFPVPGGPASVAIGPEGGIEPDELERLEAAGFRRARLAGNILRFETAGIVGLALVRALLERSAPPPPEAPS
jgi:16S rRNA (uracil1498-N3)-methyltransferase